MLTRKHFIELAETVVSMDEELQAVYKEYGLDTQARARVENVILYNLIKMCKRSNPRFDSDRFLTYISDKK